MGTLLFAGVLYTAFGLAYICTGPARTGLMFLSTTAVRLGGLLQV